MRSKRSMKKPLSILFFLLSGAAVVYFYCVELSLVLEYVIGALVIIPSRYFLLEKPHRWRSLLYISDDCRLPHYAAFVCLLVVLYIASSLLALFPVFSFYHPANDGLMYFLLFINCLNCLILAIYHFRPELLPLEATSEGSVP